MNYLKVIAVFAVMAFLTAACGGGNGDGDDVQVSLTLNNIPAAATEMRLAVVFDGQGNSENKTFTYNDLIGSTVVDTIELSSGVYDTYSLSAEVDLDTDSDGTVDGSQTIEITNAAFSNNLTTDFGHPSSITVDNMPVTTTGMRFAVTYSGNETRYNANFVLGAPVDLSIFDTTNVVSGVYDTYSLSAAVDLDTDSDGAVDGSQTIEITNAAFSDNMTTDFGHPSSITVDNMPVTTTGMRFAVTYTGNETTYTANFVLGAPVDLSIFGTMNVVSGVYDTYSLSAEVDLDTDSDGTADDCESIQQADAAFQDNMTIDFNTASSC